MFRECKIHLIQPEVGYQVGQKTGTEKHVVLKLWRTKPTMAIAPSGAMAEYEYFVQRGATFRGEYIVDYNSVNPTADYNIGYPSSDPASRIWLYEPGSLELHISFLTNDNGVPRVQNAINLRDAILSNRGPYPRMGFASTGSGFHDFQTPILHRGPLAWTLV